MLTVNVLARVLRVVINTIQLVLGGLRWMARQTYRQRSLGVMASPQQVRLLDLHMVTVAAHMTLVAALIVAPTPVLRDWLLALPAFLILAGIGLWRAARLVIGLLLFLQLLGIGAVLYGGPFPLLLAFALAQQVTLVRAATTAASILINVTPDVRKAPAATSGVTTIKSLWRASLAGLLLGLFTGGAGLAVGIFTPDFPLWLAAALLLSAAVLAARMPRPEKPQIPRQTREAPEGYAIYRPSSMDD